jgi:ribosomal protein L11 methyltransferase
MESRLLSKDPNPSRILETDEAESGDDFFCAKFFVDVAEADGSNEVLDREAAEILSAEFWEFGAEGIEERETEFGIQLLVYVRRRSLDGVLAAGESAGALTMGAPEHIRKHDWSEAWKHGLRSITVSPRLIVRPSFVSVDLETDQQELVIDPGQAFGTGGHASTLLNLEWIDALSVSNQGYDESTRVLDIGTGTGVLALAALRLGAGRAVGFDIDPIAAREARIWAARNDLADRFDAFAGPLDALDVVPFDLVLANLLRRELLPIVPQLVERVAKDGNLILSGLLAEDQVKVETALSSFDFNTIGARFTRDDAGDHWVALHMAPW